jgi:hypothetical protein
MSSAKLFHAFGYERDPLRDELDRKARISSKCDRLDKEAVLGLEEERSAPWWGNTTTGGRRTPAGGATAWWRFHADRDGPARDVPVLARGKKGGKKKKKPARCESGVMVGFNAVCNPTG